MLPADTTFRSGSCIQPSARREHDHRHREREEQRPRAAVQHGQRPLIEQHPQAAQHALKNDQAQRRKTQALHPAASIGPQQQNQQPDREHPHRRGQQPMPVLDEQIPRPGEPRLPGIKEQIVAVRIGPIGHGHAGVGRRHQPAHPHQRERRARQHHSPAMGPRERIRNVKFAICIFQFVQCCNLRNAPAAPAACSAAAACVCG